jgi:hypothetical protein
MEGFLKGKYNNILQNMRANNDTLVTWFESKLARMLTAPALIT